ncbi:Biotin synthesis protein BioC [Pseudoalteromonas luteoviolacea B = ATCC 29581]|nr:Biotin synthesis protein BioC [Pseudoalteromonas luteoviolacea B = ATCC 29581]
MNTAMNKGTLKTRTAHQFSKAVTSYTENARVQHQAAEALFSLMGRDEVFGNVLVDLGSGPGLHSLSLQRYGAKLISIDLSEAMLRAQSAVQWRICADMDSLPLQSSSIDVVFSNFAMQWSQNIDFVLGELYRVLRHNGVTYISIVLDGSLKEICETYSRSGMQSKVNSFPHFDVITRSIKRAGFNLMQGQTKTFIDHFETPMAAFKSLKLIGANQSVNSCVAKADSAEAKVRELSGRAFLKSISTHYPKTGLACLLTYNVGLFCIKKDIKG